MPLHSPSAHSSQNTAFAPSLNTSGKRNALLALLLFAPAPTVGVAIALYGTPGPLGSALWAFAKLWFLLGPLLWFVLKERQAISWSPLAPALRSAGIRAGLGTGMLMAGAIVTGYWLFGKGQFDPAPMRAALTTAGLSTPERYLLMAAYWTLFNSLVEEYAFRWFLYRQSEQLVSSRNAVLLAAVIFMAHHTVALSAYVPWHLNALGSLGVLLAGVIWSALYARYRSIWPAYISHILADIAVFAIGYDALFN